MRKKGSERVEKKEIVHREERENDERKYNEEG